MCGFESDWEHFFDLRLGPGAHPSARELAYMIYQEFNKIRACKTREFASN